MLYLSPISLRTILDTTLITVLITITRHKIKKKYEQNIIEVKTYTDKEKIPYRYWLMDSWWYSKDTDNGVKNWTAMP